MDRACAERIAVVQMGDPEGGFTQVNRGEDAVIANMEEKLAEVKAEFRAVLDRATRRRPFDYALRDMHEVLPTMADPEAPVVVAVSRAVERALGRPAEHVVSPGTYDQKHIDRIGRLRNCVAYGPGILDLAHQPDEYVAVDDMIDAALVMGLALADLLEPEAG